MLQFMGLQRVAQDLATEQQMIWEVLCQNPDKDQICISHYKSVITASSKLSTETWSKCLSFKTSWHRNEGMIALPTFQTCSLFKDRAMSRRKSREEVRSQPSSRSLGGTREPQSLRDPWTAAGAGSSQGTVTGWWESNKDALYPLALDSLNNQVLSPGSSSKPPSSLSIWVLVQASCWMYGCWVISSSWGQRASVQRRVLRRFSLRGWHCRVFPCWTVTFSALMERGARKAGKVCLADLGDDSDHPWDPSSVWRRWMGWSLGYFSMTRRELQETNPQASSIQNWVQGSFLSLNQSLQTGPSAW